MSHQLLVTALAVMSVIVALEGVWLADRAKPDKYLSWLNNAYIQLVIRLIYFLGFPYLVIISGLIPARLFGLKGIEFIAVPDFSQSFSAVLMTLQNQAGTILLVWLPDIGPTASVGVLLGGAFLFFLWLYLGAAKIEKSAFAPQIYHSKLDAFLDVIHWSFYRAALWLIFGSLYLGVLGGTLFIIVEYVGASRIGKFSNLRQQEYLLRFSLGLITSVIFLFVPNLWFIFIMHFILLIIGEAFMKLHQNRNYSSIGATHLQNRLIVP